MRRVALPLLLALTLALAACAAEPEAAPTELSVPSETPTPTPTPDPAPPAVAELVVTPEGLGTLHIGEAAQQNPATDMVTYSDDVCESEDLGISADDPLSAGWPPLSMYGDGGPTAGPESKALFAVAVGEDGTLLRIDIEDSTIPTSGGIHIGDPASGIMAAHPDAVVALSNESSTLYRITGTAGVLDIEVEAGQGNVSWMRVNVAGTKPYQVAASDNVIFSCKYTP